MPQNPLSNLTMTQNVLSDISDSRHYLESILFNIRLFMLLLYVQVRAWKDETES